MDAVGASDLGTRAAAAATIASELTDLPPGVAPPHSGEVRDAINRATPPVEGALAAFTGEQLGARVHGFTRDVGPDGSTSYGYFMDLGAQAAPAPAPPATTPVRGWGRGLRRGFLSGPTRQPTPAPPHAPLAAIDRGDACTQGESSDAATATARNVRSKPAADEDQKPNPQDGAKEA